MRIIHARAATIRVTLLGCLLVAGCTSVSGFPDRTEDEAAKLSKLRTLYFAPTQDVLATYDGKTTDPEKRTYRNNVVYGHLQALDLQFSIFSRSIYTEATSNNLGLDIAGVAVGVSGAVTTVASTSRILSALSGGIAGSRTAIDKNLYFERTMPALLALMESGRSTVRTDIERGLLSSPDDYPLGKALSDLERYYNAGSLPGALAAITATAGKEKAQADGELKTTRDIAFVNTVAQKQVDTLLDLVTKLPNGKAKEILDKPPADLDAYVKSAVTARLGGNSIDSAAGQSSLNNDATARTILRMVLVLLADRSKDSLSKWQAALKAS